MDWFNENVIARGTRMLGTGLWKGGDQGLIDGTIVNGSWKVVGRVAGVIRWLQTGFIYHYAFAMLLGIFILMTYFVWFKR
ncbi:proton-translocating NADH-quinone oxidoreductase, chain L [compost metagenome]